MNRGIRFVAGWLAAASTAVGLSWAVIHSAVAPGAPGVPGSPVAASAPALVPPVPTAASGSVGSGSVGSPAPVRVSVPLLPSSATPGRSTAAPPRVGPPTGGSQPGSPPSGAPTPRSSTPVAPTPSVPDSSLPATPGAVRTYAVTGGRVVLRLTDQRAQLVSATPDQGFRVSSWEADGWLRVDFGVGGTTRSSVFATWNGTPPSVRTVEY